MQGGSTVVQWPRGGDPLDAVKCALRCLNENRADALAESADVLCWARAVACIWLLDIVEKDQYLGQKVGDIPIPVLEASNYVSLLGSPPRLTLSLAKFLEAAEALPAEVRSNTLGDLRQFVLAEVLPQELKQAAGFESLIELHRRAISLKEEDVHAALGNSLLLGVHGGTLLHGSAAWRAFSPAAQLELSASLQPVPCKPTPR